jgi:hypothetical protein
VPYVFRIKDLFFLAIFLPLLYGIYNKDKKVNYVFSSPLSKVFFLMILLCFIQVLATKLRFPAETFASIIRMGRRYFYYAIFFPALYILIEKRRFVQFGKLSIFTAVTFSILFIIQFIVGSQMTLFPWGDVVNQELQGYSVTRLYVQGTLIAVMFFHISFMIFVFYGNYKFRLMNFFVMVVTGAQALVEFGRANMFGIVSGIIFGVLCAWREKRIAKILRIVVTMAIIVILISSASKLFFREKESILEMISARAKSTFNAILNKDGTFGFRLRDNVGRIEMVRRRPFLGIGFLHDESNLLWLERGFNERLRTSDSGLLSLMLDFGVAGILWLLILTITVFRRGMFLYQVSSQKYRRVIILGILSFYFGRLFSFLTLANFVTPDGIVMTTFSLVALEAIAYGEENKQHLNRRRNL